jgi:(1->4)-alpha-D-glucan 1-alpha-D-glucosylmutase
MVPRATYRVQFSKEFGFDDAAALAPYLADLGISHVYASPYLKARPNSPHGYDVTDHNSLNPELGDQAAFIRMIRAFEAAGLQQILDCVPNHMGVGGSDNPFWLDLLEWGAQSVYANWFDVDWESHSEYLQGKLLVPFLGDQYGAVLSDGKLQLKFDPQAGEFAVWAYEIHKLPVSPWSYSFVLRNGAPQLDKFADEFQELQNQETDVFRRAAVLKLQLAEALRSLADVGESLLSNLRTFQGVVGNPASWSSLDQLIRKQHWRAAHFRVASDDINYRRFFNISDLAGIRMESPAVFQHTHQFVLDLLRKGIIHGLRIDHIDGLFDPREYLVRLRQAGGASFYLVVEKILAQHEPLRPDWPVHGTTGYDFASQVTQLLVDTAAEARLTETYRNVAAQTASFATIVHDSKSRIMENEMASELFSLARAAGRIARQNPATADFTENLLRRALKEIVAHFPVYRTYVDRSGTQELDRRYIHWAVVQATRYDPELDESVFHFWEQLLTADLISTANAAYDSRSVIRLAMRVQQFSGPVMAKGFEDTALFRFNRFAALNEVGSAPGQFGSSAAAFHKENLHRSENWPHSLLTSSTHDTKHGEDARARLAALSLVPDEWSNLVVAWSRILRARRGDVEGTTPPARNDEYLFFQNLVATWPTELIGSPVLASDALALYAERLKKATIKSMREARLDTNWLSPNIPYENAVSEFISDTLNPQHSSTFLESFLPFAERIAVMGVNNSLAQTVLKLASPGVPDFYQGCELWDFSFLDPDNRRSVDYQLRRQLLAEVRPGLLPDKRQAIRALRENWQNGAIKLAIIHLLLDFRKTCPNLFLASGYHPLTVTGSDMNGLCAFMRTERTTALLVIVSLDARFNPSSSHHAALQFGGTPQFSQWCDLLTDRRVEVQDGAMPLRDVFAELPVAVFVSRNRPAKSG